MNFPSIDSPAIAAEWLRHLVMDLGINLHPDHRGADLVSGTGPMLSAADAVLFDRCMDEVFNHIDPYDATIDLLNTQHGA